MSAAQLDLDAVFGGLPIRKAKKQPATRVTCKCGHHQDDHANHRHTGVCSLCRGECKRFRPKSKPPVEQPAHLAPPNGAIILERDDTKNAKTMGWALIEEFPGSSPGHEVPHGERLRGEQHGSLHLPGTTFFRATIYLAQLKTKSPNVGFFGGADRGGMKLRARFAWLSNYKKSCRDRAASAIAQLGTDVAARGRPTSIALTRVGAGRLDQDNLRGAMKYVVDGIAEALGFNDAELADSASRAGSIPISYAQEKAPPRVCGVRIVITWRTA